MEFDILNEIMTGTVAMLFTDLTKHSNYMKTSSQMGQDKSEIPKSMSSNDLLSSIDGPRSSIPSQTLESDALKDTPVGQWLHNEAKSKLQEAMNKLGLDSHKINGRHLAYYSMDELL